MQNKNEYYQLLTGQVPGETIPRDSDAKLAIERTLDEKALARGQNPELNQKYKDFAALMQKRNNSK